MNKIQCTFGKLKCLKLSETICVQKYELKLVQKGYLQNVFRNHKLNICNISIPVRVIPKTIKIELDTSLLNTQQYKVSIKGKVEQSRERT